MNFRILISCCPKPFSATVSMHILFLGIKATYFDFKVASSE